MERVYAVGSGERASGLIDRDQPSERKKPAMIYAVVRGPCSPAAVGRYASASLKRCSQLL